MITLILDTEFNIRMSESDPHEGWYHQRSVALEQIATEAGAAALVELAKSAATVAREQRRALAAEQSQNARPAWVAEWDAEQVAAKSSTSEHDLRRLLRSRRPSQGTHAGSVRRQRGGGEGGGARGRGAC